jgi:diguanylate cyclase (GGDEF)-like protein
MDFPSLQGSQERRHAVRHTTKFGAYVVVGEDSFAVNIQDYSTAGLHLTFQCDSPAPERLAAWVGSTASVEASQSALNEALSGFDSGSPSIDVPVSVAGRVVRATPLGLGLSVESLPEDWSRLLEQVANPRANDARQGNREYDLLIRRCVDVYATFSRKLASEVLARTADRLGALEGADPFAASRYHFEAARIALAENSARVIERFLAEGGKRVTAEPGDDDIHDVPTVFSDLRLMQADELEDYLNVSSAIKRVNEHVAATLDQFGMRYVRLIGVAVAPKKNPFGPEKTLRGFRHASSEVELSPQSARVLCAELEAVSLAKFPPLLQDLNQMLAAVAPSVRARPKATAPRLRSVGSIPEHMLPDAAIPDPPTRQLLSELRDKYGGAGTHVPRRVLGIIETLATAARPESTSREKFVPKLLPINDSGATDTATLPELLAAINRLPMSAGGAFEQATARDVMLQMMRPGEAVADTHRRLGATFEGVIDTSARLFQRASRDLVPHGDVESLIKRLERTLLKLALRDGEFPASPSHPARRVVNLIDQYNFAANDEGRLNDNKLRANLDSLVTRICDQADTDSSVFDVVQHSLERDLEGVRRERRTRIDRIVEALESRDRVRVARQQVDVALGRRLSERRMPRALIRLLDEVWRQHCVLVGLRHGVESTAWRDNLLLIERTLAVAASGIDDPATLPLRKELCRELSSVMMQVVSDRSLRGRLLAELEALMVNADAQLMADVLEAPQFKEPTQAADKPQTREPNGMPYLPMQSRVGDWWDMKIERKWIPVQLVWMSQSTGHCGFVNRSASNRMELTESDLQNQITNGTSRTRDSLDVPLLDRTESGLLNEVYAESMQRADRDPVTGLLTRKGFQKRLTDLDARIDGGHNHVVALIECDQFRTISSTCGIEALESLTKTLGDRLLKSLPKDCLVALFREDSFAILMPNYLRPAGLRTVTELVTSIADFRFKFEQHSYSIGVSAGIAAFGTGQCGASEVLRRADAACLAAKASGRNRLQHYEPDNAELRSEETLQAWAGRADLLLMSEDLFLRAQMVMPIGPDTAELPYYEILLGIEPRSGQTSGPYDFVVAMERLGRSHELDLWVLRQAFTWIAENWMTMESIGGMAINLSVLSLRNPEVLRFLRQQLSGSNFPAHKIVFEITESAAIQNFDAAEQFIREIHRYGCRFALDDFGSGFTSYAHLKRLSTDTLKIDGSYIKDLLGDPSDLAIVKSMTDIAHTLGMKVVAEWVETPEILEKLVELGVDYAQGYAVHKPVRLAELTGARIAPTAAVAVANG